MNFDRNFAILSVLVGITMNTLVAVYVAPVPPPKPRRVIVLSPIHVKGYSPHLALRRIAMAQLAQLPKMLLAPKRQQPLVAPEPPMFPNKHPLKDVVKNSPLTAFLNVGQVELTAPKKEQPLVDQTPTNDTVTIQLYNPDTQVVFNENEVPVVQGQKEGV